MVCRKSRNLKGELKNGLAQKQTPNLQSVFEYFAFQEVPNEEGRQLPEKIRYMAILAVLIGCGGADAYREMLPKALDGGVTPVMIKEIVYQAVDYLGYGRMLPFLSCTNEIFFAKRHRAAAPRSGDDNS